MLILSGSDILNLLDGRELDVIRAVQSAYEAHHDGHSSLPPSSFVRFPNKKRERIIALPGYLGGEFETAGIKWIASFPENVHHGMERASASMLMNSAETGRPVALLEGSVISARRTAASAALAARHLHAGRDASCVGLIGGGLINFEITRFLLADNPEIETFLLYDLDADRARQFAEQVERLSETVSVTLASSRDEVFENAHLISFATTAVDPHVDTLDACRPGSTILHVSLRDVTADVILNADNIVDDVDHVCRAQTSVHLAEQEVGHRDFIRGTLADVTRGDVAPRASEDGITIFSPFGLGVLDLALANLAISAAKTTGRGTHYDDFLPKPWMEREATPRIPAR